MHSIDQPMIDTTKGNAMPAMTPKQVATEFGTSAKRLRKFLRSETPVDDRPGKGGRWALDLNARSLAAMRKRFDAWNAEQAKKNAERIAALAAQGDDDEEGGDDEGGE